LVHFVPPCPSQCRHGLDFLVAWMCVTRTQTSDAVLGDPATLHKSWPSLNYLPSYIGAVFANYSAARLIECRSSRSGRRSCIVKTRVESPQRTPVSHFHLSPMKNASFAPSVPISRDRQGVAIDEKVTASRNEAVIASLSDHSRISRRVPALLRRPGCTYIHVRELPGQSVDFFPLWCKLISASSSLAF
jgi:hypothetical protein